MFYCHLSAFSRQTVYNEIIISWQYTLIIRLTIAIVHSIVSRIMLLFQFDYLIKSPLVSMLCSCHAFGMLVPRLWHAQACQRRGTTVTSLWHNCAKHFAQPFQRFGTIISVGGTTVLIACHKPYVYLNGKQRKEKCWWQCEMKALLAHKRGDSSSLQSSEWHSRPFLIGIRLNDRAKWWQKNILIHFNVRYIGNFPHSISWQ